MDLSGKRVLFIAPMFFGYEKLIKSELEDLWLKYTEPEVYQDLVAKIAESKSSRSRFIKSFMNPIVDELDRTGFKYEVKGRPKSIYSIWNNWGCSGTYNYGHEFICFIHDGYCCSHRSSGQ